MRSPTISSADTADVDQQLLGNSRSRSRSSDIYNGIQTPEGSENADVGTSTSNKRWMLKIEVQVPVPDKRWEYMKCDDAEEEEEKDMAVRSVVDEIAGNDDDPWYRIVFGDGRRGKVRDMVLIIALCCQEPRKSEPSAGSAAHASAPLLLLLLSGSLFPGQKSQLSCQIAFNPHLLNLNICKLLKYFTYLQMQMFSRHVIISFFPITDLWTPRSVGGSKSPISHPVSQLKVSSTSTFSRLLLSLLRIASHYSEQLLIFVFKVTFDTLLKLRNGAKSLDIYRDSALDRGRHNRSASQTIMSSGVGKRSRGSSRYIIGVDLSKASSESDSDGDDSTGTYDLKRRRVSGKSNFPRLTGGGPPKTSLTQDLKSVIQPDEEASDSERRRVGKFHSFGPAVPQNGRATRSSNREIRQPLTYEESMLVETTHDHNSNELTVDNDGLYVDRSSSGRQKGSKRSSGGPGKRSKPSRGRNSRRSIHNLDRSDSSSPERAEPTRRSARDGRSTMNMRERLEDEEIYGEEFSKDIESKATTIREVFVLLPADNEFRLFHNQNCDVCGGFDATFDKGLNTLIYCQGCTTSIHKSCLGSRSAREHLVTKVDDGNFVMQCRRCIGMAKKKDHSAPRLDICVCCDVPGIACAAFSKKMTSKQEEKIREMNGGNDPITTVDSSLLNNANIILFRCTSCQRGFHFEHLPPIDELILSSTIEGTGNDRFREYSKDWNCKDCIRASNKVQSLVAWRPKNVDLYVPGQTLRLVNEDEKEYLVKWETQSYFRCTWESGAWIWGITAAATRNAFARKEAAGHSLLKMSQEDAVPEEFLRVEIVLDVIYTHSVKKVTEQIDKARVDEIDEVLVKFHGLGYDEAVWERPPSRSEVERWNDFVAAYHEYLAGKYFKSSKATLTEQVNEFRRLNFEKSVLLIEQPPSLTGGKMMPYQVEGMNWLVYNFHQAKNVILADEMGLGKTIQVIGALAALIKDKSKCSPFLVVVPNSTCMNWRREIKKWAPSLRVVAYYGTRKARDMVIDYELFPEGCSDMRAHVVVTSYEAPVDDHSKPFFRKIKWAGLIVDEGQRLKNDKNLLYSALASLKISFRVLLTGTPLQNNKRELFNLLQFIDRTINAGELDANFAELTADNLPKLHDLIRPYFLRRTKADVLKFLPPKAQVIIPVTMSVVQKKLYKSILAKNPDLIRSIFVKNQSQLRPSERGGLNNILIQLRKCLCHPFVYSAAIEERSGNNAVLHRNLIDAASKLQLMEIMLPKLQERGHRVLIFSQFLKQLDIIEDFLDGLSLPFQRLDGNVGSLEKQKRIDAFNAPDSRLFAFLLSTRAGGVGINLATADTVIIMDPDFNPHQDLQALSRAHRIGQQKKVLVFQLMTKDSVEEKIIQIGRKKMALDHALIESMDADDDAGPDLQSILKHGAEALFDDENKNDIHYDSASVDKLLDRSQVENTSVGDDKSAESQFSFARIWANDRGTLTDDIEKGDSGTSTPAATVWDNILRQRENDATLEEMEKQKNLGRGKRARQTVDYQASNLGPDDETLGVPREFHSNASDKAGSDTDFANQPDSDMEDDDDLEEAANPNKLQLSKSQTGVISVPNVQSPSKLKKGDNSKRVKVVRHANRKGFAHPTPDDSEESHIDQSSMNPRFCYACEGIHIAGQCPLKTAGVEKCGLCGLAHFGGPNICPHLSSEAHVRVMLDSLNSTSESPELVQMSRNFLRGVVVDLARRKKKKRERQTAPNSSGEMASLVPASSTN